MLGFLAIFGVAMAAYSGLPPWVIAASAMALAALSYAEQNRAYRRGQELGLTDVLEVTVLRSMTNAVVAAGIAYAGGWLARVFFWPF